MKIAIVGFADSKNEAPFGDDSWEIWGVNDVYAHVPRVTKSFELHNLVGLGPRRNPGYEAWLKEGKAPVYMWASEKEAHPEFPSAVAFPEAEIRDNFAPYFTNSIAWMTAFAILELCDKVEGAPGGLKAKEGAELGFWGVDMAHETEYGSQRPSCEYFIGIAQALGIKVTIPATSDLLKAGSLYGMETTMPMRVKMMKRIEVLQQQNLQLFQQEQMLQNQIQQIQAHRHQLKGAMGAIKYTIGVWTMPTENTEKTDKDRKIGNGHIEIPLNEDGSLDMNKMLGQFDLQEAHVG